MGTQSTTGHNVRQAVPLFEVRDMAASLRFYVDGLGFRMTHHWIDQGTVRWCWLELGGAAVMLQEYRQDRVPDSSVGIGVSINFVCRDALDLYRDFTSRGLAAGRPFVGNAMWVTPLTDPDGYKLSFESPTDAPEETTWSG